MYKRQVKSCDVEAWSPRQKKYFEVGICSNLGDAQARRLKIRIKNGKEKYFAHTLNNTVVAPPRMLIAFLAVSYTHLAAVVLSIVLAKGGGKKAKDKVYVEKVKTICGNDAGTTNRFSGVVEAQDSWKIKLDGDKKVKEVFVKVGDEVKEGDQLFSYDRCV